MQNLIRLLEQFRSQTPPPSHQKLVNQVREYLQILMLKSIYQSKFGRGLSFMGGTCLRICYDLKRYSEDLDFALDRTIKNYSFKNMINDVKKSLELTGFSIDANINDDDIVQKSFLKFSELLQPLGLSPRKGQKIHIKLEVDTRPIKVADDQLETFFVNKYNEIFPLLKHKKDTLFAGKLLAILSRTYAKGRDYYDLIWYLSGRTEIDMKYLNDGIVQANQNQRTPKLLPQFKTVEEIFDHLGKVINKADIASILKDMGRFMEDPSEEKWVKNYQQLFKQLSASYLQK